MPHTFQDKEGTEWTLSIDLQKAMEIEDHNFAHAFGETREDGQDPVHKISFIDPDKELFTEWITNRRFCLDMIWILVRDIAKEKNIPNMLEFAKRFDGSSFRNARVALWEELPNFFPDQETSLRASISAVSNMEKMLDEKGAELLRLGMDPEKMKQVIERESKKLLAEFEKELSGNAST